MIAAQIVCSFDEPGIDLHDDRIEWHNHVGQIVVDHTHDDSAGSPDQRERSNTEIAKELIDDACVLQQAHPCKRAEQKAHTHGKHDEHVENLLGGGLGLRDGVGDGIADQQTDERGHNGIPDRAPENRNVISDVGQICQGERTRDGVGQRIVEDDTQRNDGKERHPDQVRGGKQFSLHLRHPPDFPQAHRIPQNRSCSRRTGWSIHSFSSHGWRLAPTGCRLLRPRVGSRWFEPTI